MSLAYKEMVEKRKKQGKPPIDVRTFCQVKCTQAEKRTKQSEADSCDVNKIMAKYINTGRLPEYIKENPQFGDFTTVGDYHQSMNTFIKANEQFALLPSKLREQCQNDPAKFLEFVADPKNRKTLEEMRLAKPKVEKGVEITPSAISKLAEGISGALGGTPPNKQLAPASSQPNQKQAPQSNGEA